MTLIQKQAVLDYVGHDNDVALYMVPITEATPSLPLRVLLPLKDYEALDRPEQVTVVIQAGNTFRDLDAAFQTPPAADGA